MALKGIEAIEAVGENPEFGLLGPIFYRAYQIAEGVSELELARERAQEEKQIQARNRVIATETVNRAYSGGNYSSAGTYVLSPFPNRQRNTTTTTTTIITPEETEPLLPLAGGSRSSEDTMDTSDVFIDIPFNDEEDAPLIGPYPRQRGYPRSDISVNNEPPDDTHEEMPVMQPRRNWRDTIRRTIGIGTGIVSTATIGAGTYISNLNRPVNIRLPPPTGGTENPNLPLPDGPNPPVEPPPAPAAPSGENPDLPFVPPSQSEKPNPPENIPSAEQPGQDTNESPAKPPADQQPADQQQDEIMSTELVIVKEVPDNKSLIPPFLVGVSFGVLSTLLL